MTMWVLNICLEGNPSKRELGESSASLPKILPVTREPIHHTIPLLATRIARHEDRLNDIVNVINGLPCGHITEDVNNLIIGQTAVESKVEQMKTEFSESMEFIAALCSANVAMGDVLTSFDHELEQISAQNFSLRSMARTRRATAAPAPAATVTMTPAAMRQAIAEGVNAILDERAAAQQAQNGGIGVQAAPAAPDEHCIRIYLRSRTRIKDCTRRMVPVRLPLTSQLQCRPPWKTPSLSHGKPFCRKQTMIEENNHQLPESLDRLTKILKLSSSDEQDSERTRRMVQNPKGIQRYLVAIEYIGTKFSGAQQQAPNCITVVGVLQSAFHKFIGQPVSIFCSSRTDAGVHALSNVCHVDVERISKRKPGEVLPPHEPSVVKKVVNHFLQRNEGDIMITDLYRPLRKVEHGMYPRNLIFQQCRNLARFLRGLHDFSSFRASGCQAKSPIRNLDELNVIEVCPSPYFPSAKERETQTLMGESCGNSNQNKTKWSIGESSLGFGMRRRHRCFEVTARAQSFLYHQVRFLVGAIKSMGTGDLTVSDVERILEAKSVTANGPMAPASGLYLAHVKYDLP
ncbi:pseudouridine synthase family protein [Artemisia annua]|uniref:Pseudouridine synthase family protein n=1 Tax=Artemisia annua TaxID=35608 RepID=A0A2U1NF94_ARTAN|nr:pseudouridine synthase family protein [Artemisia annua]